MIRERRNEETNTGSITILWYNMWDMIKKKHAAERERLNVDLSSDDCTIRKEELEEEAAKQGRSVSNLVRWVLRRYLDKKLKG